MLIVLLRAETKVIVTWMLIVLLRAETKGRPELGHVRASSARADPLFYPVDWYSTTRNGLFAWVGFPVDSLESIGSPLPSKF